MPEAGYDYDLTDVPPDLMEAFKKDGICIHELDELLMSDEIIYSGQGENEETEGG